MAKELSNAVKEALEKCYLEDGVVKIPNGVTLDRDEYLELSKVMKKNGGKWSRKHQGFEFVGSPDMDAIRGGVDTRKQYQFFATPKEIAEELVSMADMEAWHTVLEPSAGQGAIVKAIQSMYDMTKNIVCVELNHANAEVLRGLDGVYVIETDFLGLDFIDPFDRIIANPPFSHNQDIKHLRKMYDCLKRDGRMVCVTSRHWCDSSDKECVEFREWLNEKTHYVVPVPAGAFSESGTNVETCIVVIDNRK